MREVASRLEGRRKKGDKKDKKRRERFRNASASADGAHEDSCASGTRCRDTHVVSKSGRALSLSCRHKHTHTHAPREFEACMHARGSTSACTHACIYVGALTIFLSHSCSQCVKRRDVSGEEGERARDEEQDPRGFCQESFSSSFVSPPTALLLLKLV